MAFQIPGGTFKDVIQKAEFLSKSGIETFMSDGKFYCNNLYDLLRSGCVNFAEIDLEQMQKSISMEKESKRDKNYKYYFYDNNVIIFDSKDKYMYLSKQFSMQTGDYQYILVAVDNTFKKIKLDKNLNRGVISFEVNVESPIFDAAVSLGEIKEEFSDNSFIDYCIDGNSIFLNVASSEFLTKKRVLLNLGNSKIAKSIYDKMKTNTSTLNNKTSIRDKFKSKFKKK